MSTLEDKNLRRRIDAVIRDKEASDLRESIDPHKCGLGAFATEDDSAHPSEAQEEKPDSA